MSSSLESPVRGRPRDPRRREAILRAAIMLVAEVGYDRMTVEALAARAGVSKPTIYRRWPGGKKEIIVDAMRSKHPAAEMLPDAGSLRGDLLGLLGTMIEHIDEDAHLAAGLISQLRASEELATLMREEIVTLERQRYDVLIARAVARGELSADARITPPALRHRRLRRFSPARSFPASRSTSRSWKSSSTTCCSPYCNRPQGT